MTGGIDLSHPDRFSHAVDDLITIIGRDWLEPRIAALRESPSSGPYDEGDRLVRALSEYPAMLEAARAQQRPRNLDAYLLLAMVAWVAAECSRNPGGEQFRKKLRDLARAGQFSRFFDTLFEGEAALYWREQMRAHKIEFPDASHPDFWATITLSGTYFRIANECKRISPSDSKEVAREALSARLETQLRKLWEEEGALKAIVWLHAQPAEIHEAELLELLRATASDAHADVGKWFTSGAVSGAYQVSVALAPDLGEWAEREIRIQDIPAVGPLRVCVQTQYLGKPQDPTRLKYVLSVRTDVLPNNIGAFERNLVDAISQLTHSVDAVASAVNVRIRPPRALGDLFEADAIVRRVLRDTPSNHVGLVILYWNEVEKDASEWPTGIDHSERNVEGRYSLQTHFIAATPSPINFASIDSAQRRFPVHGGVVMRDPETGSLAPVTKDFLHVLEQESDAINDEAATIYIRLKDPFPLNVGRQTLPSIKAGSRIFIPTLDGEHHFRVVEFETGEPIKMATLDMRAWEGEHELLFHLFLNSHGWTVAASGPRVRGKVRALAVPVRRVFV